MGKRTNIFQLLTNLPTHTKLTASLISFAIISHLAGKRTVNRSKEFNFKRNLNELNQNHIDFNCFYTAKQYHEECNDINRYRGLQYMENICNDLENKISKCNNELYNEINNETSVSMGPKIKIKNGPSWLNTH